MMILANETFTGGRMFPKPIRLKSEENLDLIRSLPCQVCDLPPPSEAHHIRSKGAGGGDELNNLLSTCRVHHHEFHMIGQRRFFNKHFRIINHNRRQKNLPLIVLD